MEGFIHAKKLLPVDQCSAKIYINNIPIFSSKPAFFYGIDLSFPVKLLCSKELVGSFLGTLLACSQVINSLQQN
jgi:hypothetical protein